MGIGEKGNEKGEDNKGKVGGGGKRVFPCPIVTHRLRCGLQSFHLVPCKLAPSPMVYNPLSLSM